MTEEIKEIIATDFKRFPVNGDSGEINADQTNPAIRLYGRRFYKDQTPVEYLAEFLLIFASPKQENRDGCYQFALSFDDGKIPYYWPEDRIALKLFSFFSSSKLETRHPVHRRAYLDALEAVKERVGGTKDEQEETLRLIQSLFGGFVGVAKNRTWVTYSFLPAATVLLSREVSWKHAEALRERKGIVEDWESSKKYFADNLRNFMGRGGELLFLQIANLFDKSNSVEITSLLKLKEYQHLNSRINNLQNQIEDGLRKMLEESLGSLGHIANLLENTLDKYKINTELKSSRFGWAPIASITEAFLFATEIGNICSSNIGTLEKLDLLQTLCSVQVLRSLCFQARRIEETEKITQGFIGNYAWIVTDSNIIAESPIRQMAQVSFNHIDEMLYRVLRSPSLFKDGLNPSKNDLKNGDDNVFRHFRKLAKEIGLVVPRKGVGQRFTLHQGLLRFLVAALVAPGERIRLTHFYQRVFAHYGIALGGEQLAVALNWCGNEAGGDSYAVSSSTAWVEEALQQGGFLVELSDAVSMVKNPG